jgi:hypothetical protein
LTRLVDPDAVLKTKIVEFVTNGDFGLASGQKTDGTYDRIWYRDMVAPDEVAFEPGVFLLRKSAAEVLKTRKAQPTPTKPEAKPEPEPETPTKTPSEAEPKLAPETAASSRTLRLVGEVPPETWNRLGTKIILKLRSGSTDLRLGLDFSVTASAETANDLANEMRQIQQELGLSQSLQVE